ncbi:M20/M25/M40 family metallo-hydrolase [Sphingomonas sp. LHG3406-1]|uniref:M20/M25/M40 family metallo-hydrolase n=1 Tax=Sphingomonas sp. LHG3406-1 TaxID=2804617 RepID=UPI002634E1F5|nr:M20/M25/M40 family metallo-hydrolase [Sphingomonas sp. LHG3406-1]
MRRAALLATGFAALIATAPARAVDRDSPEGRLLFDLFRAIVEMPTVKGREQVPKMARHLSARLRKAGFAARDIEIVPVGETAGLIVTWRGTGARPPILFLAHMDVVEAKKSDWERDPFRLHQENGFLYGRGASDNKLGVAQLVAAFITLKRQGFRPDRDLVLAFTGDEETDMNSSRALAERLAARKPEFAINSDSGGGRADAAGKPISFGVQVAEKTFANFAVTIRNPGGHSARPRPDNAIYELAELLGRVRAHQFPAEGNQRTTCVPTLLSGGHADNALPQRATATINCRILPGVPIDDIGRALAEAGGNPAAEWSVVGEPFGAPASPVHPELFAAFTEAVKDRAPGVPITPYMTPGATDGKHFRARGIPTYGVSADFTRPGEVGGVHGLNERIPESALFEAFDFWPRLMRLLGSEGEKK